ncbi:MAG: leucine-rich repeat protein, partial [Muribaculaceae bacterium]|nr:leucine-rich repeat protein [Muribaculaceae bacterium]
TFNGCEILEDVVFNENPAYQPDLAIGNYTFASLEMLKAVTLPQRLISLGNYTFAYCSALQGIVLPNKMQTMGTYVFRDDISLEYATLSNSCAWLKEGVFYGCNSLKAISIPPIVNKMDTKLFAYCSSLSDVRFESNSELLEIAYGASQTNYGLFRDCPVETLYLDRWLSYNTDQASRSPFYSIAELKNLTFGENVQVVDKYMFSYCTGLEEVVLPDNITSVGLWGFRGCSSLKNVQFSQKLSQVSDYGFAECSSLDNVIFPSSMTSIAIYSFSNCTSLKSLDLGNSLMIIGANSFMNDSALEGINLPETLYGLGVEAFMNCSSLPYVEIKGVTSVGQRAFQGCKGLKWVSLSSKTTSLGENCFAGCTSIGYVKSFAEFPPQGLTLFATGVPEEGTLFVPEYSIMYYQYDPTWENWLNIKPLTDNVLVSSISLNKKEISLKAAETDQLIVTVSTDATEKGVIWKTSDENVVSVDEQGNITAISVGDAIVSVQAIDGSGVKDECHVTVVPTLVEEVKITGSSTTLKKGRTLELAASVLPVTATNSNIIWSSSDNKIAEVDDDGIVTAISAAKVQIMATAVDGSSKFGTFELTVIPPTLGDSNDNDEVTITDAVNTANFAIGNPVENFNQEAADVNGDNRITLADASGTITIILEQPVETSVALMKVKSIMAENNADFLVVEDFSVKAGQSVSVPVMLDNTVDYVALQADITVPEGMKIESVTIGNRAESNHSLITKRIDANTVRIVLFDLSNSEFADNNEPLFNINVISNEILRGEIVIGNIIASDASANEYNLYSTGGNFSDMSGVDNVYSSNIRIEAAENAIKVFNAEKQEVAVFTTDGTTIARFVAKANIETISVVPGIYVVSAGDNAVKVVVK